MVKVVTGVVVYSYRADGLHRLTNRKPGTTRPAEEIIPYEVLTEKQKRTQRRVDALRRKANTQVKRIVR